MYEVEVVKGIRGSMFNFELSLYQYTTPQLNKLPFPYLTISLIAFRY